MRTADDFTKLLNLKDETFNEKSLNNILLDVYEFARDIWLPPTLYNFVDHGINHSYKILESAMQILDLLAPSTSFSNKDYFYKYVYLSPIERLILGISSLIHDIGMQYMKYPKGSEDYSPIEIREKHCDLGKEIIDDLCSGTFKELRHGPTLSSGPYNMFFLNYGARVGFAHSGTKYWDILKNKCYDSSFEGGLQNRRLRLLAALLRLADEIHCEYTRISELSWIDTPLLNDESKAHWVACYYTREIKITSPGSAGLIMTLNWRIPSNSLSGEQELIKILLQELREKKINEECVFVKEFLKINESNECSFFQFSMANEPEQMEQIIKLPVTVKRYIEEHLRPYQYGHKVLSIPEICKEMTSSIEIDLLKSQVQKFYASSKNVETGHYKLKTGWHTNKYVKCREICSDLNFAKKLCLELTKIYKHLNFTDIIAVGTSAIRIGCLLSYLLSARFSYTFGKAIVGEIDQESDFCYTDNEMEIKLKKDSKILIIDDILGVGGVLNNLVNKLKTLSCPPKTINVFTIFSLGNVKELIDNLTGVEIDYLVSFPDVQYLKEDTSNGTCEVCKDRSDILKIEI